MKASHEREQRDPMDGRDVADRAGLRSVLAGLRELLRDQGAVAARAQSESDDRGAGQGPDREARQRRRRDGTALYAWRDRAASRSARLAAALAEAAYDLRAVARR